jgi:predicted NBD/HSP70 family sugar kinase
MLIGGAGGYAGEWGQTAASLTDAADRRAHGGVLEDEVNRARLVSATTLTSPDEATLAEALTTTTPAVTEEVARQRRILAATLSNAVNVLNPSMIVLGGFLGGLRDVDRKAFDDEVRARSLSASAEDLQLASAALGADRLLIGAADAAMERLLSDPLG